MLLACRFGPTASGTSARVPRDDELPFRHMLQRQLQIKFLRDPNRRADIVGAVRMRLERRLFAHDRQDRVQLHVEGWPLARIGLRRGKLHRVFIGLKQQFAQHWPRVAIRVLLFCPDSAGFGFSPNAHFIATASLTTISSTQVPTVLTAANVPPTTFASARSGPDRRDAGFNRFPETTGQTD